MDDRDPEGFSMTLEAELLGEMRRSLEGLTTSVTQISNDQLHNTEIMETKLESIRNEIAFSGKTQAMNLELVKFMVENHIREWNNFLNDEYKNTKLLVKELIDSKNRIYGFALALGFLGSSLGVGLGKIL